MLLTGIALSDAVFLTVVLLLALGVALTAFAATANTAMQMSTPDHLRGRVMGLWMLLFAGSTPFGTRIAHGMLVASIATGLQVGSMEPKIATAAFMGLRDWQFRGAVFFGDTIRVKRTIGEKTEHKNPAQGFVIYEVEVVNQDDKVVQKGQWNMLIRRRPA